MADFMGVVGGYFYSVMILDMIDTTTGIIRKNLWRHLICSAVYLKAVFFGCRDFTD